MNPISNEINYSTMAITAKNVMNAVGVSQATANRNLKKVREAYNLPAYTKVSVQQYCEVYGLDCWDFVVNML